MIVAGPTNTRDENVTDSDGPVENFFLLMDPEWEATGDEETPPIAAIVGLWPVDDEGKVGPFRSNPEYVPANENSPADPTDALLRLSIRGDAEIEQLQLVLRDTLVDVAMNGDGRPLITKSPDDVSCIVIATSEVHRQRVSSPGWRRVDLHDLVLLLADDVDVLINPGGQAAVRLTGTFMRETMMMSDEEVAAAYARFGTDDQVAVVPWDPGTVGPGPATGTPPEPR
jgi:hypothetical protein